MREGAGGEKTVQHEAVMPKGIRPPEPEEEEDGDDDNADGERQRRRRLTENGSPFESRRIEILNVDGMPHEKRTRQWIRAFGKISPQGGHCAHLSALAYMSDSYFIGTVSRIHNLWRFGHVPRPAAAAASPSSSSSPAADDDAPESSAQAHRRKLIALEGFSADVYNSAGRPEVGMIVSLDHSIYFHEPRRVRADEWMFTEMESPWAGDGRGVVIQKMWAADGRLVATCFQEGVVRLKQDRKETSSKL